MEKKRKIQILVSLVLTCLLVTTIFFAVKASTKGQTLITLENKAANLQDVNQELKQEIVGSTSLSQIGKAAETMGMTAPEKFFYMDRTGVALRGANQVASLP